jgi:NADH-quinone oxidoreductase subunit C
LIGGCGSHICVLRFLRDDPSCRFRLLIDICGVDYPAREKRLMWSTTCCQPVPEHAHPREGDDRRRHAGAERTGVFPAANWFEREAFDCMASCSPATRTCAAS